MTAIIPSDYRWRPSCGLITGSLGENHLNQVHCQSLATSLKRRAVCSSEGLRVMLFYMIIDHDDNDIILTVMILVVTVVIIIRRQAALLSEKQNPEQEKTTQA